MAGVGWRCIVACGIALSWSAGLVVACGLPEGDSPVLVSAEDEVYAPLAEGKCDEAEDQLDERWQAMQSPGWVLLFQAAIELCRGDVEQARVLFAQAEDAGVASPVVATSGTLPTADPVSVPPCLRVARLIDEAVAGLDGAAVCKRNVDNVVGWASERPLDPRADASNGTTSSGSGTTDTTGTDTTEATETTPDPSTPEETEPDVVG
jgi:hypothetical protein